MKIFKWKIDVDSKDAQKSIDDLNGKVDGLTGQLDNATGGAISGFKSMASGLKGVIGGFKTLKGAIIATGIGALVVVVTAAVEWFTKFDSGVKLVSKTMDAFAGGITQLASAFNLLLQGDFSGAADALTGIADAAADAWQQSDRLFEVTKELKELQAENIPLNAKLRQELELQKKILEDTTLTEKERLGALNEVTRLSSEIQNNAIKENKLKEEELRLKIKLVDNDEERRDLNKELGQVQAELIDQEGALNIIRKDAEKVEREIISLTRQKKLSQLEEELKLQKELQDLLKVDAEEDDFQKDIDRLDKLFNLEEEQKNRRIFSKEEEAKIDAAIDKKIEEDQLDTLQDGADKRAAIREGERRNKEMNALNAANTILGINSLFEGKTEEEQKKAFQRTKKLNIASATVETFLAAQKAYTSQLIPLDPTSPVRAVLAAGSAIASGLARVAQIKKQKFNGGGGDGPSPITIGGGSSGGGGNGSAGIGFNPSTPTISALPNFATTQAQNNNSGSNVRAYVIQDDINSQTALNKRINQRTKL